MCVKAQARADAIKHSKLYCAVTLLTVLVSSNVSVYHVADLSELVLQVLPGGLEAQIRYKAALPAPESHSGHSDGIQSVREKFAPQGLCAYNTGLHTGGVPSLVNLRPSYTPETLFLTWVPTDGPIYPLPLAPRYLSNKVLICNMNPPRCRRMPGSCGKELDLPGTLPEWRPRPTVLVTQKLSAAVPKG